MKIAKRNPPTRLRAQLELTLDERSDSAFLPEPALIRRACEAALQKDVKLAQVGIVIVDAEEGQTLNRDYRGKDYATNVLTFALNEGEPVPGLPLFGDLVLCAPVVEKEAAEQNKSLPAHYTHLLVHGMLHLQGYDHVADDEAEIMETLESVIMQRLGYENPYSEEHL